MVSYISLIFYILAFIHIVLFLLWGNKSLKHLFNVFMFAGIIFNIVSLALNYIDSGDISSTSLYDLLMIVSLSFGITYIILYAKYRRPLIGMFIAPFMVVSNLMALYFTPERVPSYDVVDSIWRYVHLPFIVLGTTFLVSAFISSIMYLILEYQLKNKNFGNVFHRFPPLDTIAKINNTSLYIGYYFFTGGAALGFVWMLEKDLENLLSSAKIVFSIITWLLYTMLLVLRHKKPMPPHNTAKWTIIGFILILVTYAGVFLFMLR